MKRRILTLGVIFAISYIFMCAGTIYDNSRIEKIKGTNWRGGEAEKRQGIPLESDWKLRLVDSSHPLPEDYDIVPVRLKNNQSVDERCYPALQEMMDDCRKAGGSPLICSSYRSFEKQESLYRKKVNRLMTEGYSVDKAKKEAATQVAAPGTSEHQLGLAVDIVSIHNQRLDESQEKTMEQKWLMKNSWKYGFILRYPLGKSKITGIIYEPWHYRYVGKKAAKEIHKQGLCLEEYLQHTF